MSIKVDWKRSITTKRKIMTLMLAFVLIGVLVISSTAALATKALTQAENQLSPGTIENPQSHLTQVKMGSIEPQVTATGKVSLSVDGVGENTGSGNIRVNKTSASETVLSAYMAVATTGFSEYQLQADDVQIDGSNFVWSIEPQAA